MEQEHFVFHADGSSPTQSDIDEMWRSLAGTGFKPRGVNEQGQVLSLQRNTDWGPLVVTNDSCTHILEVAFPKMRDLVAFESLYLETWGLLVQKLSDLGLRLQFGAALPNGVGDVNWRPKESDADGKRLRSIVTRAPLPSPLFHASFPACFAATHVSLEIAQEEAMERLPHFYAFEYLVPLYFSNSPEFQGVRKHCVRPLAWVANFHLPYPLLGIPEPLPKTLKIYEQLRAECFGRDYSFIAIRSTSRVEFRSACSQNTVDDVLRLVRFRLTVDSLPTGPTEHLHSDSDSARRFDAACHGIGSSDPLPEPLVSVLS